MTGIEFASVDWQPCGHKDIVICHGESHYDFHLYYTKQSELESESMRCDKTKPIHEQIMCMDDDADSADPVNHKYFKLMADNMPISVNGKTVDYCMDPTSAIPASGVHYGDKSETLDEWVRPVTITGSHDCELTFFEPMISWKWMSNSAGGSGQSEQWPNWKSGEIVYNQRTLDALPTRWQVKVSEACATQPTGTCHIQIIVYGKKCDPVNGCAGKGAKNCAGQTAATGGVKNCLTDQIYMSPKASLPGDGTTTATLVIGGGTTTAPGSSGSGDGTVTLATAGGTSDGSKSKTGVPTKNNSTATTSPAPASASDSNSFAMGRHARGRGVGATLVAVVTSLYVALTLTTLR
jgi:hypothetical protein